VPHFFEAEKAMAQAAIATTWLPGIGKSNERGIAIKEIRLLTWGQNLQIYLQSRRATRAAASDEAAFRRPMYNI
jgi:hypothetical protein